MSAGFVVLDPGTLSVFTDRGRPGYAHVGVSPSGPADRGAYELGQLLIDEPNGPARPWAGLSDNRTSSGSPGGFGGSAAMAGYRGGSPARAGGVGTAALEVCAGGLRLRARGAFFVVLTGADTRPCIDGRPAPMGVPFVVRPGEALALAEPVRGWRSYLTVRGGFVVEPVLGSRATDVLSGLGPRPLRAGDVLAVGPPPLFTFAGVAHESAARVNSGRWREADGIDVQLDRGAGGSLEHTRTPVRLADLAVLPGPRSDWLADPAALTAGHWQVSPRSNRVGVRLIGEPLRRAPGRAGELLPEGVVRGSVQLPPDGQPVVFLADHPVTGGYPVVGVLAESATDALAQAAPGDQVRFAWRDAPG